jgi:hypothetical protein
VSGGFKLFSYHYGIVFLFVAGFAPIVFGALLLGAYIFLIVISS